MKVRLASRSAGKILAAILVAATAAQSVAGQEPLWGDDLIAKVDSLATASLTEGPMASVAVGVRKGDDVLIAHAWGSADVELAVPAGAETVYRIGSVTKQFTAAAVMQLVEAGKIDLDAPITTYLPDYPTQGRVVTVRHLLNHTSGIKSYTSLESWRAKRPLDLSDDELVALFKDEPFDFEPGERYRYNNSGYYLLGMIIERVSGEPYRRYVATHLFEPQGLDGSSYCDEGRIIPGRAEGYVAWRGALRNDEYLSMNQPGAAGALCSTVFDLLAWAEDLRAGEVVSAESYAAMTTPATLNDGNPTTYGFGLAMNDLAGHPSVAHGGGINGFSSSLAYYPEADLDVVVLVNTEGQAGRLAQTIAKWALGIPVVEIRNLRLSEEEMAVYIGTYQVEPGTDIEISVRAKRLFAKTTGQRTTRLRAQGNHIFIPTFDDQARMVFIVVDGRATGLTVIQSGREQYAPRVP